MKIRAGFLSWAFVLLATLSVDARAAAVPQSFAASGRQYVRISDWARANRFTVRTESERILLLSNSWARLVFNLDPRQDFRKAEINGVDFWLAFPVTRRNGEPCISKLDLEKTLGPILSPRTNAPGVKVRTICLDPGHGGKDPGYQVGSNDEKKYTALLAQEVSRQLTEEGFNVVLTRRTDVYVERAARPAIAKQRHADLFVSLHFNSFEGARDEAEGIETYCLTPAGATSTNAGGEGDTHWVTGNECNDRSALLAYCLQKSMIKGLAAEDRGVRRARWEVLREAQMPAVLIEGGFMSHPAEGKKIFDSAYRRRMAQAIVAGILDYKRGVKG